MGKRKNKSATAVAAVITAGTVKSTNIAAILQLKSDLITCDVSSVYGRYLKTKVDINKGTVILKEKFLVAGPKINSTSFCIGCHSEISPTSRIFACAGCKWPLCSEKCGPVASPFHTTFECKFFQEHNIRSADYIQSNAHGCITILRCLAMKLNHPSNWKKFISLESHVESRRQVSQLKEETERCARTICEDWNLKNLFTPEEVEKVCGIYEVNSFEMGDCYSFGGIFPISSMCAHNCIPNCSQNEIIDECSLEIRAILDIPAETAITLCYDACLKGTRIRKRQLKKSKYFDCTCERCTDPTECGTHFSTLLCPNCKKGLVTLIMKTTIPFGIKYNLCMAYGREDGYQIEEMKTATAHRKLELCQEVMKVLNVLTPAAEVLIVKSLMDGGRCSKNLIRQRLKYVMSLLEEAIQIFDINYATKVLAEAARNTTMKELQNWLTNIK